MSDFLFVFDMRFDCGCTLSISILHLIPPEPGADVGIAFYIGKFEASKLAEFSTWVTACSQILFSLSPGFGTGKEGVIVVTAPF